MASAGIRRTPTGRYKVWWRLDDGTQGAKTFAARGPARDFKGAASLAKIPAWGGLFSIQAVAQSGWVGSGGHGDCLVWLRGCRTGAGGWWWWW